MSRPELTRRELLRAAGTAVLAGAVRAGGQAEAMILIPAGPFLQGTAPEQAAALAKQYGHHPSWLAGEVPQRSVVLPAYRIDRCPVTHRDYLAFVQATGHRRPGVWPGADPPAHLLDHPVAGVDAADAEAY
ncbi:MAG: SUMF1/EgtB/PvdO family nonheme iron enzyme, partial [Armatimonadetes bacterium]|nr:SUMF1/EgtB/PvdO family nonheme iron enzyme [Armatimonadota bacterium]